jgi:hypothetical protein
MSLGIRLRAGGAVLALVLVAGACSGAPARPTAGPVPPSTATGPGAVLRDAIATTATALGRIQDDLDSNQNLTVPQNRYNEDIEKLAVAAGNTEAAEAGAGLSASQAADVHRLLTATSDLVAALQRSPHDATAALQTAATDMATVRQDLALD